MRTSDFYFALHKNLEPYGYDSNIRLLIKSGLVQQISSGVHAYLPLGMRLLNKMKELVKRLMSSVGAQEIILPILQPFSLWEKSQRARKYGSELFCLTDRLGTKFVLCPTAEELVTNLIGEQNLLRHQLPIYVYQIQFKFRDEIRTRFGLVRSREFLMKDCYSFDANDEASNLSYRILGRTYKKIFKALSIKFRKVPADNGAMGGMRSHEFQAFSSYGEDSIVYCPHSNYAMSSISQPAEGSHHQSASDKLQRNVWAPTQMTGSNLLEYLLANDGNIILVSASLSFKDNKTSQFTKRSRCIRMAINRATNSHSKRGPDQKPSSPVSVENKRFNIEAGDWAVWAEESCGPLFNIMTWVKRAKTAEVGHIFQLGTSFSTRMGAYYEDATNTKPYAMGCYGIGITRLLSVLVDQQCDGGDAKTYWPASISPFDLIILPDGYYNNAQIRTATNRIYSLVRPFHNVLLENRRRNGTEVLDDLFFLGVNAVMPLSYHTARTGTISLREHASRNVTKMLVNVIPLLLKRTKKAHSSFSARN